jgi:hypothetical protein
MVLCKITPCALLLFAFSVGVPTFAQSSSPESSPAGVSAQPPQSLSQSATTAPVQPNSKTVWTNDDLSGLRGESVASNHADVSVRPSATASKPNAPTPKDAKWYNDQIAKLQAQLPPLDDQISQLQAALAGKPVDTTRKWGGVRPSDWSVQLAQCQQKRDGVLSKITALKDQARHSGIPTNLLP